MRLALSCDCPHVKAHFHEITYAHVDWNNIAIRPSIRSLVRKRYGVPRYKERRVYCVLNKRLKLGPVPSRGQMLPCVGSGKAAPINGTPQKIARDAHVWAHLCIA